MAGVRPLPAPEPWQSGTAILKKEAHRASFRIFSEMADVRSACCAGKRATEAGSRKKLELLVGQGEVKVALPRAHALAQTAQPNGFAHGKVGGQGYFYRF